MRIRVTTFLLPLLAAIAALCTLKCGPSEEKPVSTSKTDSTTGYKNLNPDVKYVGMETCRQCHMDKYLSFMETGMGQSIDIASHKKSSAKFDKHSVVYDKHSNLYYYPYWDGDSMRIKEFRLNGKDTVHLRIETVDYIIGSGQHTNSHIFGTNGYLHQMPATYYTQQGRWDLPPGYENGFNSRFSRKIGIECMSCHNSYPEFVEGSDNKFVSVPGGIGCERCHGPGEVHVKEMSAGIRVDTSKYIDYSIVNPGKLSADLQFDVCQRCHLQGNAVLKEGKTFLDFRPGMKLSDIMSVFMPKYEGADDEFIMASHAERLKRSKCFIQSETNKTDALRPHKNGLTCVTCHDPHVSVKATGKEVFNNTCRNCHSEAGGVICSEKTEVKAAKQDDCVSCHMPKSGSIDIPHVTVTDHFIGRKVARKTDLAAVKKFLGLYSVNEKDPEPKVKARAYLQQYERFEKNPVLLDSAFQLLNSKEGGDYNTLIHYYFIKSNFKKIIELNEQDNLIKRRGTSDRSSNAWAYYHIGEAYSAYGKTKEAKIFYEEALKIFPLNIDFLNKLAGVYVASGEVNEAKKVYEKIIAENPNYAPAWSNLGFMHLQTADAGMARTCYDKAITLNPDYEQALLNMAGLLIFEKKNDKALIFIDRALKINPKNEQALSIRKKLKVL